MLALICSQILILTNGQVNSLMFFEILEASTHLREYEQVENGKRKLVGFEIINQLALSYLLIIDEKEVKMNRLADHLENSILSDIIINLKC
jgi:hypothetical protein